MYTGTATASAKNVCITGNYENLKNYDEMCLRQKLEKHSALIGKTYLQGWAINETKTHNNTTRCDTLEPEQ